MKTMWNLFIRVNKKISMGYSGHYWGDGYDKSPDCITKQYIHVMEFKLYPLNLFKNVYKEGNKDYHIVVIFDMHQGQSVI